MSLQLPEVLMCRPEHFGVEYVINPWMEGQIGRADRDEANRQWDKLYETVSRYAAAVHCVEPGPHLPDMVFTANAGLILEKMCVLSNFRVPQREPEVTHYQTWLEGKGYNIVHLPDQITFEGEGDALFHPGQDLLWAGYGVRSGIEAHALLTDIFQMDVVSLRLVDERFYHLDTCFYPLPDGRVVYYPLAFDTPSLQAIHERVSPENRIEVSDADALNFTCNTVRLGEHLITNHASAKLEQKLAKWGYQVHMCPLSEFMLAGGAAKCLTLLLDQEVPKDRGEAHASLIRSSRLMMQGHLLDQGLLNRAMDIATDAGLGCHVEQIDLAERRDQDSHATLKLTAPTEDRLETVVSELMKIGATPMESAHAAQCQEVVLAGVAPDDFYSTTIYPTDVYVNDQWVRVTQQRMDAVIVVDDTPGARCVLMRDLKIGEQVVTGIHGIRVHTPDLSTKNDDFAFMSASVSSERRVEQAIDTLAWEMQRIQARQGRIAVVAGPVVIHTGGGVYLEQLIEAGYVQTLLTGNALPVHDMEQHLFGTSLGVDLNKGIGVHGGHKHHLKAINLVRKAGSIKQAVQAGLIQGGVMHACVQHEVDYVIAGSIRDDGPLPDTLMDLIEAQQAYAKAIEGCDMILMLSSMLHSIGTGNMTPAGVKLVCVDISPAVVTKLADRGSVESIGIVTDVGLFLHLLAQRLCETSR